MQMQRIFICDGRKDCLLPSCKNEYEQCRFTTDSTHAAPEMQINSTIERIISVIGETQKKDFTE